MEFLVCPKCNNNKLFMEVSLCSRSIRQQDEKIEIDMWSPVEDARGVYYQHTIECLRCGYKGEKDNFLDLFAREMSTLSDILKEHDLADFSLKSPQELKESLKKVDTKILEMIASRAELTVFREMVEEEINIRELRRERELKGEPDMPIEEFGEIMDFISGISK